MHFPTTFLAVFSLISISMAAMGQGAFNYTRDYVISYDPTVYTTTETFCRAWRNACVNIAGPLNEHHQLDCVFSQKGPVIRAFCGGIAKDATGGWVKGQEVFDHSAATIPFVKATITGPPLGKTACLKFKKTHGYVVC